MFDAAVAPVMARHSHAELDDTPCLDGGFFVLMGNDEYLLRQIAAGERQRARDYAGMAPGVGRRIRHQDCKPGRSRSVEVGPAEPERIDDPLTVIGSPRESILETLAEADNAPGLPHPVHIHCNNLGRAGQRSSNPGQHAGPRRPPVLTLPTSSFTVTVDRVEPGRRVR